MTFLFNSSGNQKHPVLLNSFLTLDPVTIIDELVN